MNSTNLKLELIKQRRKEIGLSQENMANELGIDQSMYCKIEKGEALPNYKKIVKIAELLSFEIDEIMDTRSNHFHNNDQSVNNSIVEELHNHNDIEFFKKIFESYQKKSEEISDQYKEIIQLKNKEIEELRQKLNER